MTQDTTSYIEMLRKFGSDLGLPKLDVDKLIEAQKKNIDALSESARAAAQGAQSVAQKQREVWRRGYGRRRPWPRIPAARPIKGQPRFAYRVCQKNLSNCRQGKPGGPNNAK